MRNRTGRLLAAASAATASLVLLAGPAGAAPGNPAARATAAPQVRVNQQGYAPSAPKVAYAMLPHKVAAVNFTVASGRTVVFRGRSRALAGGWNAGYHAIYRLSFSGLTRPGRYRITIAAGGASAVSPSFAIASPSALYHRLVGNAVRYYESERDGAGVVPSVLNRKPANLTDRHASVFANPRFDGDDNLLGKLHKIGGPVNVSGGWFDAGGGYEKFAYTGAYTDGLLLLATRDTAGQYPTLAPEAQFGLNWLEKLWRPARKVLYIQVGIGTGNASNTIQGDYNFWFLPQAEDKLNVRPGGNPGPSAYYVKNRPVLEAARPGARIDPDFAGRFAADFALGAQLSPKSSAPRARHLLSLARHVFAMAKTSHIGQLQTVYPHDFYPGTEWKSDMLWGATEIALADESLGAPAARVQADLKVAARWARAYLAPANAAGRDTLNLYDPGAIGESELIKAMRAAHTAPIAPGTLLAGLAKQLRLGESRAHGDPFSLGTELGASDATPHAFGLFVTDALYRQAGGSAKYRSFAQQQLNYDLGANPWGSAFVVGAGHTFPHCMQSEIANLSGTLNGKGAIQLGATTDGPSARGNFVGLGTVDGMRKCSAGNFKPFNNGTVSYQDNVVSWPSVEPADDYTAISLLAFVLAAQGRG